MKKKSRVIDLTQDLRTLKAYYPDDPQVAIQSMHTIESDGYATSVLQVGNHVGTHLDFPGHLLPGGALSETLSLSDSVDLVGYCVDLTALSSSLITPSAMASALASVMVKDIEVLVIKTTNTVHQLMTQSYTEDYVSMDMECGEWLIDHAQSLRFIGTDYLSIEPAINYDLPVHKGFLRQGIYPLTGLHLQYLPQGWYDIHICPLYHSSLDGLPCRVWAVPYS